MTKEQFIKKTIELFGDKTGCRVQHKGCPCNSCFHSIKADFQHITWLILLGLRGDYDDALAGLLEEIEEELNKELDYVYNS